LPKCIVQSGPSCIPFFFFFFFFFSHKAVKYLISEYIPHKYSFPIRPRKVYNVTEEKLKEFLQQTMAWWQTLNVSGCQSKQIWTCFFLQNPVWEPHLHFRVAQIINQEFKAWWGTRLYEFSDGRCQNSIPKIRL
jgi:hypothetical protein